MFCYDKLDSLGAPFSTEVCLSYVLLNHSLSIEKRTIQGNTVSHDIDESITIIESGNDNIF